MRDRASTAAYQRVSLVRTESNIRIQTSDSPAERRAEGSQTWKRLGSDDELNGAQEAREGAWAHLLCAI